jgi:hypothetical protein
MEQESGFLSNENKSESEKVRLSTMLKQILEDLNSHRMTTVIGVYVMVVLLVNFYYVLYLSYLLHIPFTKMWTAGFFGPLSRE